MKTKLFFGFLVGSILAMVVSFGCLNSDQETYEITTKPPKSKVNIVAGEKNAVNFNENSQFGMVRIRGKF